MPPEQKPPRNLRGRKLRNWAIGAFLASCLSWIIGIISEAAAASCTQQNVVNAYNGGCNGPGDAAGLFILVGVLLFIISIILGIIAAISWDSRKW